MCVSRPHINKVAIIEGLGSIFVFTIKALQKLRISAYFMKKYRNGPIKKWKI